MKKNISHYIIKMQGVDLGRKILVFQKHVHLSNIFKSVGQQ